MTDTTEVIEFLDEFKSRFDVESDEYADVSQTIHYLELHE